MRGKVTYAAVRFSLCSYLQRFSGLRVFVLESGVLRCLGNRVGFGLDPA